MRRTLAAALVACIALSSSVGDASRSGISSRALAAGSDAVSSCDDDGIRVDYRLAWAGEFVVDRLTVGGIADSCIGLDLSLILIVGGRTVDIGTSTIRARAVNNNVLVIELTDHPRAVQLEAAHVLIT